MRQFILFVISAMGFVPLSSQSYVTAIGLRMGSNFGISAQQRIFKQFTIEGIVSANPISHETTGTILAEIHNPLISRRFNFYIGGGLHNRWLDNADANRLVRRGVTGIAGAEMTLGRVNIAWDYKPVYHLNVTDFPFESETAISLRYVFVKKIKKSNSSFLKQSDRKKRQRQRKRNRRNKENKEKKTLSDIFQRNKNT